MRKGCADDAGKVFRTLWLPDLPVNYTCPETKTLYRNSQIRGASAVGSNRVSCRADSEADDVHAMVALEMTRAFGAMSSSEFSMKLLDSPLGTHETHLTPIGNRPIGMVHRRKEHSKGTALGDRPKFGENRSPGAEYEC